MRDGPPFGDLRVVGPAEARSPAPPRHDKARLFTRRDSNELGEAGPAGRRDGPDVDPSALVLVYPMWNGVLVEEGIGCDIEERQPKRRTIGRGQCRAVPPHGVLVRARRFGERRGSREPEAPDDRVGHAQREQPSVRRERSGDDAVADVERLVALAAVELRGPQRWIAEPVPASIHRRSEERRVGKECRSWALGLDYI